MSETMSPSPTHGTPEDLREAAKTYTEQTKLFVGLASALGVAQVFTGADAAHRCYVVLMIVLLIVSVLCGYFTLGALAGTQYEGEYNIYRPAIRITSILQVVAFLGAAVCLILSRPDVSGPDTMQAPSGRNAVSTPDAGGVGRPQNNDAGP